MQIIINNDNLNNSDIQEFSEKVRAILISEDNKILVANYGNVILLPGGKVDEGETIDAAIIRELKEEIGKLYSNSELDFFATLDYYQKDYPKRDGTLQNRLVRTHYFASSYKNIDIKSQKLTEKEQKDNFSLELVSLDKLEQTVLENTDDNPRNVYFQTELLTILLNYISSNEDINAKKLQLK